MWFKQLAAYRLHRDWKISLEQLTEQLERGLFVKCASNQPTSRGWVSPRKDGSTVFNLAGQWLICLKTEERILPASVIADELKERADAMETQQGYPPGRKQLKELKERITEELMPRAFTRSRKTFAWIDAVNGWFCVDAASQSKAEEVIEHLRHCLDSLPLAMIHTQISPQSAMADWLAGGEAPDGFTIDRDCELKAAGEEKSAVRYVKHPLEGDIHEEIKSHLAAGKLPTKLALTWDDRISFVLGEKLEIKRLAFLDLLKEEAEKSAERADEQFDADFALMTGELRRFIPQVVDALGGEVEDLADQGGGSPAPAVKKLDDMVREDGGTLSVETAQGEVIATIGDGPDPLYEQAVRIVKSTGRASISLIQRNLVIGYNRASRLIEQMEKDGIVSTMRADGTRQVQGQ